MTPEEKQQFENWMLKTENRMNFLVEQQAVFETNQQKIQESIAQLERVQEFNHQKTQESIAQLERVQEFNHQKTQESIAQLTRIQMETTRQLAEAVQTALEIAGQALVKTDKFEVRVTKLENAQPQP